MVYFIDIFQSHAQSYNGLVALKRSDKNDILLRIDSPHGVWDQERKQWKMMPVTMRYFSNNMVIRTVTFRTQFVSLSEGPLYFSKESRNIEDMSIRESWEYIHRVQSGGFGVGKELVEFNWKFSFPFGCVMMVLIGGPLSAFSRRNILITSFLLAFLGTLIYYVILYFCYTLGKNEVLNPFLAAWMGNFIFAGLSAFLLTRTAT
jgi:lipopolysaccharide export system permease protein